MKMKLKIGKIEIEVRECDALPAGAVGATGEQQAVLVAGDRVTKLTWDYIEVEADGGEVKAKIANPQITIS